MFALGILLTLVSLLLMAYAMLEIASTRPSDVRALPKPLWFVVVLAPVVGAVAWFVAGRPAPGTGTAGGGAVPPAPPAKAPDDDEAFLRELRRRAEEQRRQAERRRRDGDDRSA